MTDQPVTINVDDPQSLASLLPYLLGFQPQDSLTVTALRNTTVRTVARLDLPTAVEHHQPFQVGVKNLAAALTREAVTSTVLVGFGPAGPTAVAVDLATTALGAAGIAVQEALRVTQGRIYNLTCGSDCTCPADGIPFDPSATVVAAQATYAGLTALPDRAAFAAIVAPAQGAARRAAVAATVAACQRLTGTLDRHNTTEADQDADARIEAELLAAGRLALAEAIRQYRTGLTVDDDTIAKLTVLLDLPPLRDMAASGLAGQQWELDMWTDLVRRAEPQFVAAPACVAAICALRAGNSVLALAALDRALHAEPDNRLALLLLQAVNVGMSPAEIGAIFTN